jgi:hypothetical protein
MSQYAAEPARRLVEWGLGLAIAGVMMSVALPTARSDPGASARAQATVAEIQELLVLARDRANATGRQHVVFFESDPQGAPIVDPSGEPVLALLARDIDPRDDIISLEYVASVPFSLRSGVDWGAASARIPAPGDPARNLEDPWTFVQPDGRSRARWLGFHADGSPRAFFAGTAIVGDAGSGAGAIYLQGPRSDYAVVVSPSGTIEQHRWSPGDRAWERGRIR